MIDVFGLTAARFETFLLVLVRCTIIMALLPVFSARQIPQLVRVGVALIVSFVIFKTVPTIRPLSGIGDLATAVLSQAVVALLFGFVAYLVFMGIQFAGEILDIQIGFGIVNVINPTTQQQVTIIGELTLALATLIFLISDSHLLLLSGLGGSFDMLPLPWVTLSAGAQTSIVTFFTQALLIVFKVAAPASVALFLVNVGLALLARVAPQMNVFVVGFPLQIGVGLVMLILILPVMGYALPTLFRQIPQQLDTLMRSLRPA